MIGLDVFLVLLIARLILPACLLLFLGEWMRRRDAGYYWAT